jgi:hypothetical protein
VQKEVEVAMMLAGMRQQKSGIDVNDLLSVPTNNEAIDRLAGFMTQDQIKQMQDLLNAVSTRITRQPEKATAEKSRSLDSDMDAILAGNNPASNIPAASTAAQVDEDETEDERDPKRQKTSSKTPSAMEEEL